MVFFGGINLYCRFMFPKIHTNLGCVWGETQMNVNHVVEMIPKEWTFVQQG
jgi:hypothetical protein